MPSNCQPSNERAVGRCLRPVYNPPNSSWDCHYGMSAPLYVDVIHRRNGEVLLRSARWCSGLWCRMSGLQLRRRLKPGEAIILVHPDEGVFLSSIHMFFVFFTIGAIWIDGMGRVTSAQVAKPWRPYYRSPTPAQYVLETTPDFLSRISVGDELNFVSAA